VIAPLLEIDRISLASSDTSREKKETGGPLAIHVYADNSIALNGKQVAADQLQTLLLALHRLSPDGIPQLFHDRAASFGTYQAIKNAVEAAGFAEMDVYLKPG
jgi:biopolymer transport protein ExbD